MIPSSAMSRILANRASLTGPGRSSLSTRYAAILVRGTKEGGGEPARSHVFSIG